MTDPHKPQRYALVGMKHRGAEALVPKTQNAVLAKFIDAHGTTTGTPRQRADRSTPIMALDVSADPSLTINKQIDARLHLGSNQYPLVEIV